MRKRFRGNKPIATSTELEAGGGDKDKAGMLYAGKGAYEKPEGVDARGAEQGEYEVYVRNDGVEDLRKK